MSYPSFELAGRELELERLVLIVVGAHIRAEVADRPLAYQLRDTMLRWMQDNLRPTESELTPIDIVVCSDVWWINNDGFRERPTVSIGGPGVNALSAYMGDKVPSAFVVDDSYMVQMDVELTDLWVCLWGMNHETTLTAVDTFVERYLDSFMRAVLRRVESA